MGVIKVGKRNEVYDEKRNVASDKAVKKEMLERDDNTERSRSILRLNVLQ